MKILRVINTLLMGGAERCIAGNVPRHIKNGYEMDVLLLNGEETFFVKRLKDEGVTVFSLGEGMKNIYNPLCIFKIVRIINRYDIVHVHLFPSLYWVALAKLLRFSKTKLVYTEHSTENRRRGSWLGARIDNVIYKQYETIIAISDSAKQNLIEHLKHRANIETIPNGVDLTEVRGEAKIQLDEFAARHRGKKILLQIARFRKQKDQDTVDKGIETAST